MMNRLYLILLIALLLGTSRLWAQETISGVVRDENGPVPSVSILLGSGQQPLTATDVNGRFRVSVPANSTLVFKSVGYEDYRLQLVVGKNAYSITLKLSEELLEEAVVVGYQKRSRESLTGSTVVISGKEIQDVPAASFTDLLQGKVAGLNIQLNNGTPGMRGSMAIRGVSNVNVVGTGEDAFLTPTSPLFVIDGVPIDDNSGYEYGFQSSAPGISPLSLIPPEDVEDIVILKDAQATALYGSRGAYGVILVTTKRGNSKIPIVQYTSQIFLNTVPELREVIGGVAERRFRVAQILQYDSTYAAAMMRINDTPFLADSLNAYYNNSTNWQSHFYRNTINHSQNVNISGGDQQFNYKLNGGFYQEKGIIENTGFNRYTMQMNMQYRPSQKFMLSAYINSSLGKNSTGSGNAFRQSGVGRAANTSSLLPPPTFSLASNAALAALTVDDDNKTANIVNQVELQYQPIEGLTATTTLNYTYNFATKDRFLPAALNANSSEIFSYNDRRNKLYNRTMLSFTRTFFDKHTILAYGFTEVEFNRFRADAMLLRGTPNDQITSGLGYDTRNTLGGTLNNLNDIRLLSYAGAFNYNFDSRYIAEFTYRIDGSSATGNINPWSYNPSIGVRWNFKEESFMQDIDWFSYGWLRGSWGRNISPNGNIYDVYGRYTSSGQSYNNRPGTELDLKRVPNISLLPTKTTQLSGAIELGFFNSRLTFVYENYYKQTDQQLRSKLIANHNAFGEVVTNETAMVNMGHEMLIGYRPQLRNTNWDVSISANGAINRDYLTALPDAVRQFTEVDPNVTNLVNLYRLGLNSRTHVLLHYKGVYQSDDDVPVNPLTGLRYRSGKAVNDEAFFRAGDPIWTDLNGDYILDENDFVYVGNALPLFTGGANAFVRYKQWSLNTQFVLNIKRDILNNALTDRFRNYSDPDNLRGYEDGNNPGALVPLDEYDVWRMAGDDTYYPNPFDFTRTTFYNPYRYDQTLFMEDGSYVKFQTATLAYNFDRDKFVQRLGITSLRLYLTANNIYTFSRYSGPDPELVSAMGRDSSSGYPNRRSYTFGFNIQF